MSAGVLPVPVSIVLCAALLWALGALLARLLRKFDVTLAVWALAAGGLLLIQAENALGWRGTPHAALSTLFLALAIGAVLASFFLRRADGGLAAALPLAGLAVAFSSGDGLRALSSGLLLIYFIAVFIGAIRGAEPEPETAPDAAQTIERPPLRRPARVRGAREIALAIVAGALALQSGVTLLPQPEAPTTAETGASPEPEPAEAETAIPAPTETAEPTAQSEAEKPVETPAPESNPNAAAAPAAAQAETRADPRIYLTQAGDSLRVIAVRLYGRPNMLKALAKANPRIKPDARLPAGREIRLPFPPTQR